MSRYSQASLATGLSVETLEKFFSIEDASLIPGVMAGNHRDDSGEEIRLKLLLLGIPFNNGKGTPIVTLVRPKGTVTPAAFIVTKAPFLGYCKRYNLPTKWDTHSTLLDNQIDFWRALQKAIHEDKNFTPKYRLIPFLNH